MVSGYILKDTEKDIQKNDNKVAFITELDFTFMTYYLHLLGMDRLTF